MAPQVFREGFYSFCLMSLSLSGWAPTALGAGEGALERDYAEYQPYLDAAAVLVRADEAPDSANPNEIATAIALLQQGLDRYQPLMNEPEVREELLAALVRHTANPDASAIIAREVFGGWLDTSEEGRPRYRSYPSRHHTLERLTAKLSYIRPDTAADLAKRFFYLRHSIYLQGMSTAEARAFSDICSTLAGLASNPLHRRGLLEVRPYRVPAMGRVNTAVSSLERGEDPEENMKVLAEYLSVSDVVDAEPELEAKVLRALASSGAIESVDYIVAAVVRRRPGPDDSAVVVEDILSMLADHVASAQGQGDFTEALSGKLLQVLWHDRAQLHDRQEQRLIEVLRNINEALPRSEPEAGSGPYSTPHPHLLTRIIDRSTQEGLIGAVRVEIEAEKKAYAAARPGPRTACPNSFLGRLNARYGISF